MFSNHWLLKVAGLCLVFAGILPATPTAAQAQSSRAKSAASYFARGSEWLARGEFDRAVADYNLALSLNPRYAEVYANRGMLHLRLGRRADADADFARCGALKPDMRSLLEQRVNQLQAQLQIQTRR